MTQDSAERPSEARRAKALKDSIKRKPNINEWMRQTYLRAKSARKHLKQQAAMGVKSVPISSALKPALDCERSGKNYLRMLRAIRSALEVVGNQDDCQCQGEPCLWCKTRNILEAFK